MFQAGSDARTCYTPCTPPAAFVASFHRGIRLDPLLGGALVRGVVVRLGQNPYMFPVKGLGAVYMNSAQDVIDHAIWTGPI